MRQGDHSHEGTAKRKHCEGERAPGELEANHIYSRWINNVCLNIRYREAYRREGAGESEDGRKEKRIHIPDWTPGCERVLNSILSAGHLHQNQ